MSVMSWSLLLDGQLMGPKNQGFCSKINCIQISSLSGSKTTFGRDSESTLLSDINV